MHMFEPRYCDLTRDALATTRLIAITLLKPGFESAYQSLTVPVYPIVCVGRIIRDERLRDGRYNLLVEGVDRAEIVSENLDRGYRRALLSRIPPIQAPPCIETELCGRIRDLIASPALCEFAARANLKDIFECPGITLSNIADLLAHTVLPTVDDKLRFLAEPCVHKRATCVTEVLESIGRRWPKRAEARHPGWWPPPCCDN